ncbi:14643_t:CDS:1, partial [Dentiscutata heterogama]
LMAFAPLFSTTRKNRYTESVARFLSDLQNNLQLLQDLQFVPSINLIWEEILGSRQSSRNIW